MEEVHVNKHEEHSDNKHQRRQAKVWTDYSRQQGPTGTYSGVNIEASRTEGDAARSHSYSSSRRAGESRGDVSHKQRSSTPKAAKNSTNSAAAKRDRDTSRSQRTGPGSAAQKHSVKHFEVKMCDFPELSVVSSVPLAAARDYRTSVTRPSPTPQDPHQSHSKPRPPAVPASKLCDVTHRLDNGISDVDCLLRTGGSAVTSWANVASQPPREKTTRSGSNNLQSRETTCPQKEAAAKKKRRRKKKSKEEEEEKECVVEQEPPRYQDEAEFPGLTPAVLISSSSSRSTNTQEKRREQGHQQQQQDKLPVSMETVKKGQKTGKFSGKKSKAPVELDIGNMLAVLEKKQQSHKDRAVVLSVSGGLPVVHKPQWSVQKKTEKFAHNPLDSTSPLVKKGKQREVPKVKKPTPLKKVILKEREERKQRRLLEEKAETGDGVEEQTDTNITEDTVSPTDEPDDLTHVNQSQHKHEEEEGGGGESRSDDSCSVSVSQVNIHSRKFRDYCTQMLSTDVDECVTSLLKELVRFQDRLYHKDPMKARMKRRMVMGLREVLKHLRLRKVKCVIISPNCERVQSKGGLDEALYTVIDTCRQQDVPLVFALSRKALGRCVNKAVPVSLVGIFNYDGAQDHYHKMIELSSEARGAYDMMVSSLQQRKHGDEEAEPHISCQAEEAEPTPDNTHPEEPEYIKLWRKMLVNDKDHQEALDSSCLNKHEESDKIIEEEDDEEEEEEEEEEQS